MDFVANDWRISRDSPGHIFGVGVRGTIGRRRCDRDDNAAWLEMWPCGSDTDGLARRHEGGLGQKCGHCEQIVLIARVADTIYGKSFACKTTTAAAKATIARKPSNGASLYVIENNDQSSSLARCRLARVNCSKCGQVAPPEVPAKRTKGLRT